MATNDKKSPISWMKWVIPLLIISGMIILSIAHEKETLEQSDRSLRHTSGIFQILPGTTVTRDTNGNPIEYLKGERVILEVLVGPHKDLIFMNKNIPHIKITKKRTFIRGVGPNNVINKVELMNTGEEEVFVEVEVQKLRHRT